MENDLVNDNSKEKNKERANKIVNDIFDKYESNSYMYQKINTYFCNQIANMFENMNESHNQRVIRFNELTNEQDTFIQSFLNNNQYFYIASTDNFFYYDGIHYQLFNEDDILYNVLNLLNRDGSLMSWKQKTRLNIMKRIRETSLLHTVPESATIQSVIDRLCPIIFKTRAETKHFLTILGDNIFRKNSSLIYFIDPNAKFFLTQLNHMSQMFIGCNLSQTFKYKYHDHKYEDCRLININSNVKSEITYGQIINQNVPDILCVACHYSLRYNSADDYIENYCNNVNLPTYVYFMKNMNIHELINEFVNTVIDIDETQNNTISPVQILDNTKTSNVRVPQITWKNMQYLWKQFLGEKCLPAVVFLQSLKTMLMEKLEKYYNSTTDSFIGVCSKFIPSIHKFLDFWNETIIEDDTEYELEIDELLILFRKWCETNNEFVPQLNDKQMVDLIVYYHPSIEIDRDKYISKVRCCLWDKQLEIQVSMDALKMQLQNDHMSIVSDTMRVSSPPICQNISIYDAYIFYCKSVSGSQTTNVTNNNRRQIISKGYFEKYIFDNYQEYIIDSKFISGDWYAL